jgi:hypothetical protein
MSQKTFLNKSNISLGSDSSIMKNGRNVVIGNEVSSSNGSDRMDGTSGAIVIGNGPIKGVQAGTTTNNTSALTKIPNGSIMIGKNPAVPTQAGTGVADVNSVDHLILGSGIAADGLVGATTEVVANTDTIPFWYNGKRYKFLVSDVFP